MSFAGTKLCRRKGDGHDLPPGQAAAGVELSYFLLDISLRATHSF